MRLIKKFPNGKIVLIVALYCTLAGCKKNSDITEVSNPISCFNINSNFSNDPTYHFLFSNCSQNYSQLEWNFGDGTSSTTSNPDHTFNHYGSFNVTLSAINASGTRNNFSRIINIGHYSFAFLLLVSSDTAHIFYPKRTELSYFDSSLNFVYNTGGPAAGFFIDNPGEYPLLCSTTNDNQIYDNHPSFKYVFSEVTSFDSVGYLFQIDDAAITPVHFDNASVSSDTISGEYPITCSWPSHQSKLELFFRLAHR